MLNIIMYKKAEEQIKRNSRFNVGLGCIELKKESDFLYPDWIIEEYPKYREWLKKFSPKLP